MNSSYGSVLLLYTVPYLPARYRCRFVDTANHVRGIRRTRRFIWDWTLFNSKSLLYIECMMRISLDFWTLYIFPSSTYNDAIDHAAVTQVNVFRRRTSALRVENNAVVHGAKVSRIPHACDVSCVGMCNHLIYALMLTKDKGFKSHFNVLGGWRIIVYFSLAIVSGHCGTSRHTGTLFLKGKKNEGKRYVLKYRIFLFLDNFVGLTRWKFLLRGDKIVRKKILNINIFELTAAIAFSIYLEINSRRHRMDWSWNRQRSLDIKA
ncbi:hypothetical protein ALC56_13377 [Trachymyrmex septentrionalis]|uniref:Uncharacterized protein n=1 Tax=Trachymyrmex septentrionalis TaxID=34720 RepID=A0A195EXB2_9HYME|nr:hypothetical protein ALC56_13377 [Trachymyrmex septentrionalis]